MHIFVYLLLCICCVFVVYCDVVRYQMERLLRSDMHICFVFVVVVVVVYVLCIFCVLRCSEI